MKKSVWLKKYRVLLIVCLVIGVPSATWAIRFGTEAPEFISKVFMKVTYNVLPTHTEILGSSSVNVKYQRCILTAAHTFKPSGNSNTYFYRGVDLQGVTENGGYQHQQMSKYVRHPLYDDDNPLGLGRFRDLAVVWLKNFQDRITPFDQWRIIYGRDYEPMEYMKAEDLGINSVDPLSTPPILTSAPNPNVQLAGYGDNNTTNFPTPQDTGFGVLRQDGSPYIDKFFLGRHSYQIGSYFEIKPQSSQTGISCNGDSGGPMFYNGKVAGISHGGEASLCTDTQMVVYTSFEATPTFDLPNSWRSDETRTNYHWIGKAILENCGKTVTIGRVPVGNIPGEVLGTISHHSTHADMYPEPLKLHNLDGEMRCKVGIMPPDDPELTGSSCSEIVHEDDGNVVLYAYPLDPEHYEFDKWLSPASAPCPCPDEYSPTCQFTYDDIGVYTADESSDDAVCYPRFKAKQGGGGGG